MYNLEMIRDSVCSLCLLVAYILAQENVHPLKYRSSYTAAISGSYHPQVIHEYGEPRWNDTDRRIPKNSE
jgi:hypothetical protein